MLWSSRVANAIGSLSFKKVAASQLAANVERVPGSSGVTRGPCIISLINCCAGLWAVQYRSFKIFHAWLRASVADASCCITTVGRKAVLASPSVLARRRSSHWAGFMLRPSTSLVNASFQGLYSLRSVPSNLAAEVERTSLKALLARRRCIADSVCHDKSSVLIWVPQLKAVVTQSFKTPVKKSNV